MLCDRVMAFCSVISEVEMKLSSTSRLIVVSLLGVCERKGVGVLCLLWPKGFCIEPGGDGEQRYVLLKVLFSLGHSSARVAGSSSPKQAAKTFRLTL